MLLSMAPNQHLTIMGSLMLRFHLGRHLAGGFFSGFHDLR